MFVKETEVHFSQLINSKENSKTQCLSTHFIIQQPEEGQLIRVILAKANRRVWWKLSELSLLILENLSAKQYF